MNVHTANLSQSHTAFWLIGLFAFVAIVMAAAGRWRTQNRKERATSHETDDKIFSTAPRWGQRLNEKLNTVLAGQRRLHQHIGSEADADYERDESIMATQAEMVEKIRGIKDFSASTNEALRQVLALLRAGQSDPAKNAEAMALLEEIQANDMAILKENTPIDPSAE